MDQKWQRTHHCSEIKKEDAGKKIILNGWIDRLRNHGGLIFISLRDRYGITQITINEEETPNLFKEALSYKMEYCLAVIGIVSPRSEKEINSNMPTGEVEILPSEIEVLNTCETLPFMIKEEGKANDTLRLEYRYLSLRNEDMQYRMILRSKLSGIIHKFLQEKGFLEIETPTLVKSTPEGARDFIVPSRIHKGSVYALAQSPQLFKQMLMMGGLDRYYQIARCYRDEDPRGDRQAEFTQIDLEMTFVSQDDVMRTIEEMLNLMFIESINRDIPIPFPRMTYHDAMTLYGSDKPDTRFDLLLQDATELAKKTNFQAFLDSPTTRILVHHGDITRKQLSELEETAKTYGLNSLGYFKVKDKNIFETGLSKFINENNLQEDWSKTFDLKIGDTVIVAFGSKEETILNALGQVRLHLGRMFNLIDPFRFAFVWVDSFPLFEEDEEKRGWQAKHHMFTRPKEEFINNLSKDPKNVLGELYDLVCNGWELGSGSIRVHEMSLQEKIFNLVGFSKEKAEERFGYLLKAMTYGAPPHGGIALGFDRLIAIMTNQPNIREVIAFPRNTAMSNPLDQSPSPIEEESLKEIGIEWTQK